MLGRSVRSRGFALTTLAMAACASAASPLSHEHIALSGVPPLTPTSRVLDADHIRRSEAQTAWDAIRLLVPGYRFQSAHGSPLRLVRPDMRSAEPPVRLVIDRHHIRDLDALRAIPAQDIVAIHLLSAMDAAMYFGPGSGGGAIVVQTRMSTRPF
jgi:hypothetical protein